MSKNAILFWNRIDDLRKSTKMSLNALEVKAGLPANCLKALRTREKYPCVDYVILLSLALNCSLDWLLLGSNSLQINPAVSKLVNAYEKADITTRLVTERILSIND